MKSTAIGIRVPDDLLAAMTVWRESQPVTPSQSATILEAIRRLIAKTVDAAD